jgi:hypothetical protein
MICYLHMYVLHTYLVQEVGREGIYYLLEQMSNSSFIMHRLLRPVYCLCNKLSIEGPLSE